MIPSFFSNLKGPRNTCIYGLGHTKSTRRNSSGLEIDYIEKIVKGTNLQNIEKLARKLYIADFGKAFVQRDQSGAEALIVAYLCRAGRYRELFNNNIKSHVYVALHVFANVWEQEMNQYAGDIKLDIKEFTSLAIPDLPKHPQWKSLNKLIKKSDEWPAEKRYYYIAKQICHCVDALTEVLTPKGWINVSKITNEQIMLFNKNTKELKFEKPFAWNNYEYNGEMINIDAPYANCLVTPNHKVLCHNNGKEEIREAKSLIGNKTVKLPICGNYLGGESLVNDYLLKLAIALQADGNVRKTGYVHVNLKRFDKINRLKIILKNLNVKYKYRCYTSINKLSYSFLFHLPKELSNVDWIDWKTKTFNYNLLRLNKNNLHTMLYELRFWDGSTSSNRIRYCSTNLENIKIFHTIAHLLEQRASIVKNNATNFVLTITDKGFANWSKLTKKITTKEYTGNVYCPTTSTGFFLIRRNGKISITGNSSNYDIKPNAFSLNTLIKSKGRIVIKKQEAEKYLEFYHSTFPEIREWHRDVRSSLEKSPILYNLFNHPYYFDVNKFNGEDKLFKEIYAIIPQSTVATITAQAVSNTYDYIVKNKLQWDILADTHDSFMTQCPTEEIEHCNRVMKQYLNVQLTAPRGEIFSMKSEGMAGFNWAPYKEGINENGLKEIED